MEYNKKKYELDKYKNQLIQERIKQNKLQKEMNSTIKKEEEFKKIEENNNIINNNSEELILKMQRSEKIREEQSKIIDELLLKANLDCETNENDIKNYKKQLKEEKKKQKEKGTKQKLTYKYNDEEIGITCKTNKYTLSKKGLIFWW